MPTTGQKTLGTTGLEILPARANRVFAEVKNADAAISVYIGDFQAVGTTTGHLLGPGEAFTFERYNGAIYAVALSGTPVMTFIEW